MDFKQTIALLLALSTLQTSASDWGQGFKRRIELIHDRPLARVVGQQALNPRGVAPGYRIRPRQNPFWKSSLLVSATLAVWPFFIQAQEQSLSPGIEEARHFDQLMPRFVNVAPELVLNAREIDAAETAARAAASRNVSITLSQEDLTRSPRIPLGNSSATPGSGKPAIEDTAGRTNEGIEGPIRTLEALSHTPNTIWKRWLDRLRTLALRGGYTFNSKSTEALSAEEGFLAEIDAEEAAAKPLSVLEPRWLHLQDEWFELANIDIQIRRHEMERRYAAKMRADAQHLLDLFQVDDRLVQQRAVLNWTKEIDTHQAAILSLKSRQQELASHVATRDLQENHPYSPLLPQTAPTANMIAAIRLASGGAEALENDQKAILRFRSELAKRLELGENRLPQDPFSLESRHLLFDRVWQIPGANETIVAPDTDRDMHYAFDLNSSLELLEVGAEGWRRAALAPPDQRTLAVKLRRTLELAKLHTFEQLRQWSIRLYIKLGMDLPLQTAMTQTRRVDSTKSQLLIEQQHQLGQAIQAMLDVSNQNNDTAILKAGQTLENAWKELQEAAKQSMTWLGQTPTYVDFRVPSSNKSASSILSPAPRLAMWQDPGYRLEQSLYNVEEKALALEAAHQRLRYYLEGRAELDRLISERVNALRHGSKQSPAPPTRPAKQREEWGLPKILPLVLLGLIVPSYASAASYSVVHPVFPAHAAVEWGVSLALVVSSVLMPHFMRQRYSQQPARWYKFWISLTLLQGFYFPFGGVAGLLVGSAAAWAGWKWSPESLTRHTPGSFFDHVTHSFHQHPHILRSLKRWGLRPIFILWLMFPSAQLLMQSLVGFVRIISSRPVTTNATTTIAPRWPLIYTPTQSGRLVKASPAGKYTRREKPYFVRWIGPNESAESIHDALFVFQSLPGTGAVEDAVSQAQQTLTRAHARLNVARNTGKPSAVTVAEAELENAKTQLRADSSKGLTRNEPMAEGLTLELDSTVVPDSAGRSVSAGVAMTLAYQKSSRALRLELTLSPQEALALGEGMAHPEKHIRLCFKTGDLFTPEIVIPTSTIRKLRLAEERRSNARTTDVARGGIPLIPYEADVYIPETMDQGQAPRSLVPASTLAFIARANSEESGSLPVLESLRFDAWEEGRWAPFAAAPLKSGELVAHAMLRASPAQMPRTSAPTQTAQIDTSSIRAKIAQLEAAINEIKKQQSSLPQSDSGFQRRLTLDQQLAELDGQKNAASEELTHAAPSIRMTAATGIAIGPRDILTRLGDRLIFADAPIARLLNPNTQQNPTASSVGGTLPPGILSWTPQALSQIQEGATYINITTPLRDIREASTHRWLVFFPSQPQPVSLFNVTDSHISDSLQGLSSAIIYGKFSLNEARALIPLPGSIVPVRLQPPATDVSDETLPRPQEPTPSPFPPLAPVGLALAILGGSGALLFKHRSSKTLLPQASTRQSRFHPDYPDSFAKRTVPNPETVDGHRLDELARTLGSSYVAYEYQDSQGRPLNTAQRLVKRFGLGILLPEDAALMVHDWELRQDEHGPNSRIRQARWILAIGTFVSFMILGSPEGLNRILRGIFAGQPMIDIIRAPVADVDLIELIQRHWMDPYELLAVVAPLMTLALVGGVLIFGGATLAGQYGPAVVLMTRQTVTRLQGAQTVVEDFARAGKEWHPDGLESIPDHEIRRLSTGPKALQDDLRLREQDPTYLVDALKPFGLMITARAACNLWKIAEPYLNEDPVELDRAGHFYTEHRRHAAASRLWAEIMRDAALAKKTPHAFIPKDSPLDSLQQRVQFDPKYIDWIANHTLQMNLEQIQSTVACRVTIDGKTPKERQAEIDRRVNRIRNEYVDRALVFWAYEEMQKRPQTTALLLYVYDLMGLPFQKTGDAAADSSFVAVRGKIELVLDKLGERIHTLLPQAAQLREKYRRDMNLLRTIRYLEIAFGVPDPDTRLLPAGQAAPENNNLLNLDWAREIDRFLVDTHSQKRVIRERTDKGVPTFEAVAFEYYLTGQWPEFLAMDLKRALTSRLGYPAAEATAKVKGMKDELDRLILHAYMGWNTARLIQKSAPDQFPLLLSHLSSTRNRDPFDIRHLSDPAPLMDREGHGVTSKADLLIAELRYRRLLETIVDHTGTLFGPIDWFGDLALEVNPRSGGQDAGLDARMVNGAVNLLALSEPSDGFATLLGLRMPTRVEEKAAGRIRVRISDQAEPLLPTAGAKHPGSILELSPQPPHFRNAMNTHLVHGGLTILCPPNLYLKYAARLIYFNEAFPGKEALLQSLPEETRAAIQAQLDDIRPYLERMNIQAKVVREWDATILEKDVPSEEAANSFNTILIILPHVRPPQIRPEEKLTFDPASSTIETPTHLTRSAAELLERTLWGEGGEGAEYTVKDSGEMFAPGTQRYFRELRDPEKRLLAFRFMQRNDVVLGGQSVPAMYHSLTTVAKEARSQGAAKHLAQKTMEEMKLLLGGRGMAYCKIEADNTVSKTNIQKRGYVRIGETHSGYLSRLNPKASSHMRRAKTEDRARMLELLRQTHSPYELALFDAGALDPDDHFYVWEENGTVQAVINAKKTRWPFRRLKKWLPAFLTPLLGKVYLTRKLFNLGDLHSLMLGNIAYAPGQARRAVQLIEAAMASNRVNAAWGFFDKAGPVYRDLQKAGAFGPTGFLNIIQDTQVDVYAYGFDEDTRRIIQSVKREDKKPANLSRKPTFVDYRNNLGWMAAPFLGLWALLGLSTSGAAAAPLARPLANSAEEAIRWVVQAGDSPWSLAQRILGDGARYHELLNANPDWVHAGAKAGLPFLIHPGDMVHIPGFFFHSPQAPIPPMHEISLEPFMAWWGGLGTIGVELVGMGAVLAVVGGLVWLWNRRATAFLMVGLALQGGVVPPLRTRNDPPKPSAAQAWIDYAQARRSSAQTITDSSLEAQAERLRLDYLAVLAERQAELLSKKTRLPVADITEKRSVGQKVGRFFIALFKPATKPLEKAIWAGQAPEPVFDTEVQILKAEVEDLIRTAKRNVALAEQSKDRSRMERAATEATALRLALTEPQDVPNLATEKRFENVFHTSSLWEAVVAGTSQLEKEVATIRQEALVTPLSTAGTEKLSAQQKRVLAQRSAEAAQKILEIAEGQREGVALGIQIGMSFAQHLRYLGMPEEAEAAEHEALRVAQENKILPKGSAVYRFHRGLRTMEAPDDLATLPTMEANWLARARLARNTGFDLRVLFPQERAELLYVLKQEAILRTEWAVKGRALRLPAMPSLSREELASIEKEVMGRTNKPTRASVAVTTLLPPETIAQGSFPRPFASPFESRTFTFPELPAPPTKLAEPIRAFKEERRPDRPADGRLTLFDRTGKAVPLTKADEEEALSRIQRFYSEAEPFMQERYRGEVNTSVYEGLRGEIAERHATLLAPTIEWVSALSGIGTEARPNKRLELLTQSFGLAWRMQKLFPESSSGDRLRSTLEELNKTRPETLRITSDEKSTDAERIEKAVSTIEKSIHERLKPGQRGMISWEFALALVSVAPVALWIRHAYEAFYWPPEFSGVVALVLLSGLLLLGVASEIQLRKERIQISPRSNGAAA